MLKEGLLLATMLARLTGTAAAIQIGQVMTRIFWHLEKFTEKVVNDDMLMLEGSLPREVVKSLKITS